MALTAPGKRGDLFNPSRVGVYLAIYHGLRSLGLAAPAAIHVQSRWDCGGGYSCSIPAGLRRSNSDHKRTLQRTRSNDAANIPEGMNLNSRRWRASAGLSSSAGF